MRQLYCLDEMTAVAVYPSESNVNLTAHICGRRKRVALSPLREVFHIVLQRRYSIHPKKIVARVASFVDLESGWAHEQSHDHGMKTACPFAVPSTPEYTGPPM